VTALGTLGVLGEVLLQVLDMTAVGASLAPGVHAADDQAADATLGRLHGLALVAIPSHLAAHGASTFPAIRVHRCRVLVELLHRSQPGAVDHLAGLVPQLIAMQLVHIGVEPVLLIGEDHMFKAVFTPS